MIKAVEKSRKKKKPVGYPKLMKNIYDHCIYLFTDEDAGVLVKSDHGDKLGTHKIIFDISNFREFNGKLILENV